MGKITARDVAYLECSSERPPKFSGGIGVYRVIVGLGSLWIRSHTQFTFIASRKFVFTDLSFNESLICTINEARENEICARDGPDGTTLPARTLNGKEKGRNGTNPARPDQRQTRSDLSARPLAHSDD